MKKVLQMIWCWLALATILWLVIAVIEAVTDKISEPVSLGISVVLAALATWLIGRRSLDSWSTGLARVFVTLLLAAGLGIFVFFCMVPVFGIMAHSVYWTMGIAMLLGLVGGFLISRKGILRGLAVVAAILILTVGVVEFHAHRQKAIIKDFEQKWAAMRWKMDLKGVFPMAYSKPQCDAWFDAIGVIAPKGDEEKAKAVWKKFSDEVVVPMCGDELTAPLQNGQDLKVVLLSLPGAADPRWPEYKTVDSAVRTAMEQCPHVQWFEPEEFKDRLVEAPIPSLLGLMRWTRGALILSQLDAAAGRFDEARVGLDAIHRGAEKMLIPGQTLIGTLIGIAMEKLSMVGQASAMAMGSGPLSVAARGRVEEMAMQDLGWFAASWKAELMTTYSILKNADGEQLGMIDAPLGKVIPLKTMVHRALHTEETENYLFNMTQTIQSLLGGYDRQAQKFGWAHHRSLKPKGSQLTPNLNASYGRALSLLAQARLVLLMDEVLKYRQEHKVLPENLDFVQAPWRADPFDEKPLRYKKEGDNLFVVYSVGTDGRDDGAQKLYVSGAMEMKDELKEDIGFRILVPPPPAR